MLLAVQDGEDFDCPICLSPPNEIVITRCAHIFCRICILKAVKRSKPCCPLCRTSLPSSSDIFSAPPESLDSSTETEKSSSKSSSKVRALLNFLNASKAEDPNRKSVVFSQFKKMLLLLEDSLKEAGFEILRLDGSMDAKKRASVIKQFSEPGSRTTVLLASLKTSNAGINLTAASRVYLMEPWWNSAVEEQAMDRVHRIGQKEDVEIVKFIARNSIEEKILELQEKKKTLSREAFRARGGRDKKRVSLDDLKILLSL